MVAEQWHLIEGERNLVAQTGLLLRPERREQAQEGNITHVTFFGTFDVHRRDEAALLRQMRLLRLVNGTGGRTVEVA